MGWEFLNDNGDFRLENPQGSSYLYFPLANMSGMMSSITPLLGGDIKTSQNTFLMAPVSPEDLHNSRNSRNFWVYIDGYGAWSAAGRSSRQLCGNEEESVLEAGLLWHKVTRENRKLGFRSEIVNFVPASGDKVELMRVKLTNTGVTCVKITPTAAIPIYGRSADNIRDHRHVTSLLHRTYINEYGVEVQPALSFDERGHRINRASYAVLGADENGRAPIGMFPVIDDFIGEGGNLEWPRSVTENKAPSAKPGDRFEGYEAAGALRFADVALEPWKSVTYFVLMGISEDDPDIGKWTGLLTPGEFDRQLEDTKKYWLETVSTCEFHSGDRQFDGWMKWVAVQPVLRRIYGCSFLPHHDYGRGGRGWRDLWQDCLALLVMDPQEVRSLLYNNFAGVRIDGSNATIIGAKPGEFLADRNNIPRVWMDHGAWPFLTTLLYLDLSGDLGFLLEKQSYFKDALTHRSKKRDTAWGPQDGNRLKDREGRVYEGTLLEHMILQNVVQFYNVGEHNNIRIEGADWNDALDMASRRGESVAFTALYGSNLREMSRLLLALKDRLGTRNLRLAREISVLFDTLGQKISYESVEEKHALLETFFEGCKGNLSGETVEIPVERIADDLRHKADWIVGHIRENEWVENKDGLGWFNGYYNNDAQRVEGDHPEGVRMTLTGQVFSVMGGIASDVQVGRIAESVRKLLKDERIGYRLNSRFEGLQLNLGRAFGFAFGHKENGAMFSHMAIMYGNALYKRGFVKDGYDVVNSIFSLCSDFENARIYPGIPEYINERGRGMYHYLTGSASWLLLTVLSEIYGIRGVLGDLALEPKLVSSQFDLERKASAKTIFAGKNLVVTYENASGLDFGEYSIKSVTINGKVTPFTIQNGAALINRSVVSSLCTNETNHIVVTLA